MSLLLHVGSSLVAASWGYSLVAVLGRLIVVASLVAEHEVWGRGFCSCSSPASEHRLFSCGTWAQLPCSIWDILRPGI